MENAVLLKAIIDNAIDGLITVDEYGIIESVNPAACKLFNYTEGEIVGNLISILMSEEGEVQHYDILVKSENTDHVGNSGIGRELTGLKKDGSHFPFYLAVTEVKYADRILYAGFIHDLSREKEIEIQLENCAASVEDQVRKRTLSLRATVVNLEQVKTELNISLQQLLETVFTIKQTQRELNILWQKIRS